MKYVIWLVIALAVIVWFQRVKKNIINKKGSATGGAGDSAAGRERPSVAGESPRVEEMVACTHCGLHFPASEAVTDHAGTVFCSEEHRRLHAP
jgi:uncharacterized protein